MYTFTKMHFHEGGGRGQRVGSGLVPTAHVDSCEGRICVKALVTSVSTATAPGESRAVRKGTSETTVERPLERVSPAGVTGGAPPPPHPWAPRAQGLGRHRQPRSHQRRGPRGLPAPWPGATVDPA